ncbi:MAG TPA: hypothetical protein VJT67_13240 [Longimicrobiaceae bacterium]|nr:hypothetical protein [Longimicrobiaceae bacterium]
MTLSPGLAQILALQVAGPVLLLSFGVLALRVAPGPGNAAGTAAWYMAGVTFSIDGGLALAHSLTAVPAVFAPRDSAFYIAFVSVVPALNDARTLLVLGFAAALAWVVLLGGRVPPARKILWAAGLLTAFGFGVGLLEPPLDTGTGDHLGLMSLAGAATAVLLFAALYRGMLRGSVDWLFWVAVALYAAQEALSSNIQTALAWAGFGGSWAPPLWSMLWSSLVAYLIMLVCSTRRVTLARTGGRVPGLMERLRG